MATGGHGDEQTFDVYLLPPCEAMHLRKSQPGHQILDAFGNDYLGSLSRQAARRPDYAAEGGDIEVVHVRVGQENEIDRRELFDEEPRAPLSAQHDQALCEDWIDQDFAPGQLEQEGGVTDEGYA
jgi:hypothetical protein